MKNLYVALEASIFADEELNLASCNGQTECWWFREGFKILSKMSERKNSVIVLIL